MDFKSIIRAVKNLFRLNKDRYVYRNQNNRKWAYISYIPRVYYKKRNSLWFDKHQNRKEALIIGEVFKRLGYNYVMVTYNKTIECDYRKYDIIFGEGPCFSIMSKRNRHALKIYYATTAYPEYQNKMVRLRTDDFNCSHNAHLTYSRLAEASIDGFFIDKILQIGSKVTVGTYPVKLQDKITLINQSSNLSYTVDPRTKLQSYDRTQFVWMGSTGSLLKGLDIVLDFFMLHPEYHLHVIGTMDTDFGEYYLPLLKDATNITLWGFQQVGSNRFINILGNVTFCIYPSASEGGCPGAVIALMKMGIIPLVSSIASFEGINSCGLVLDGISVSSVSLAVEWSQKLSDNEIEERIQRCISLAGNRWNLMNFEKEFESYMKSVIASL